MLQSQANTTEMRIGIDGLPLTAPKTGVGHYTFELARALAGLEPHGKRRFAQMLAEIHARHALPAPGKRALSRGHDVVAGRIFVRGFQRQ